MNKKQHDLNLRIKSVDETGEFTAYGNVFNVKDRAGDITLPGAFKNSIERHLEKGTFPRLLSDHSHNSIENVIGVITHMEEDEHGLLFRGKFLIETTSGKDAYIKVKNNAIDSFSIGYATIKERYDATLGANLLEEVDVKEISLVIFPANEESKVLTVKAALDAGEKVTVRMAQKALREAGFSKRQSESLMNAIRLGEHEVEEKSEVDPEMEKQNQPEMETKNEAETVVETKTDAPEMNTKGVGNSYYCKETLRCPVISQACVYDMIGLMDPQGLQEVIDAVEASRVRQLQRLVAAGKIDAEELGLEEKSEETEVETKAEEVETKAETEAEAEVETPAEEEEDVEMKSALDDILNSLNTKAE